MKKKSLLLGAAGALSFSALAWFLYKKKNKKQSDFQKMQKLLEKTIYEGFNKKDFTSVFSELTKDINNSIAEIFKDEKFAGQISCSNQISGQLVGFYCFDCEANPQIESNQMTQCADCFSKANHDGHRYSQIISSVNQIACKCGDHEYIKNQGFCKDHKGLTPELEQQVRDLLIQHPEEVKKFNKLWKGVFLQVFFLIENSNKMNLGKEMGVNVVSVIDQLLLEVVSLIKQNVGYSILFSDFLTSTIYSSTDLEIIKKHLMQQYSTNPSNSSAGDESNLFKNQKSSINEEENVIINRMLYHNCRSTQEITFVSTAQRMSIPCKCSYIENLIRFSSHLIVPGLTLLIQDMIIRLQSIPQFKKFTSSVIPKMLCFIDSSSKFLSASQQTNFFSPFLMVQRFTYPVEYGCQMILDMNSFGNIFSILSKMIEGMALQTKQDQLWEVMQILYTLKSLTSQSEVNFLILLTDTTFLKNLLKTLSKIEKRGISSIFGQQNLYVQISYLSSCQSFLQFIVYQFIRDMTLLANETESLVIFQKLQNYISSSTLPSAKKLKDLTKSNIQEKHEEMLQFFFSAWVSNYESVQFDKKSISNQVNSKQDFLTFSSLVSILLYSVAYRDFKGQVENISYNSIVGTLMKYLQNNSNSSEGDSEEIKKEKFLEQIKSLFIDLDNNIHKNPYSIFSKEQQIEQLNQIMNSFQYNQNQEQLEISLSIYKNQWKNHNNEVVLLLRQIGLLIVGESLHSQFFEPFQKIIEEIEEKGEAKKINALAIPKINSQINFFAENACLSFLYSYHIQLLKANFIPSSTTSLQIENMDIHLRSSLVQCIIQFFFFKNNSVTMALYKDLIQSITNPFKKFGLDSEKLLIKFSDFDARKKTFSLKKQYLLHGSNLHIWNSVSFLYEQFNSYVKNYTSEATGTVQDILFVQEDFSFNKIVTIENLTYQFNYLPKVNIVNFTRFITSDKLIKCLESLFIGIKNIPKNIPFLTLLQYIVYFIKESKHSPEIFADIAHEYKPSLFKHLYDSYIKSNLLQTFFLQILQVKDTQNIQEGTKLLLKMINTIIQEEEGIINGGNPEEQQPLTAEEIEKQKEELRKKKIEEAKKKQQEMLQKFASQRNTFQQKQEDPQKQESNDLPEIGALTKQKSVVKNQDNEAEFCSICSEQIEKNSEYGYPIYIKQSNTLNYLQQTDIKSTEKNEEFYISVNSCGHFYHHKCWLDYQTKNSQRNERNAHLYRNESEIPCSLCKRLANNFIQYLPENMRSKYSKQFIKANQENGIIYSSQKLKDTFKQITSNSDAEEIKKQNQDFFDSIQTVVEEGHEDTHANNEEHKEEKDLSNSTSQLNPLLMSKSISKSMLFTYNDFITNVQDYLTCLSIQNNNETEKIKIDNLQQSAFEKIFLKPFHHIEFSEIQEFISTNYKVYNNLLEYMRINYLKQIKLLKSHKTDLQLQCFSETQKESNLSDLFLREILSYFCLSLSLDPLHDINLFCQYFILILCESVKEQENLSDLTSIDLVDIIQDEFKLQNHMDKLKQLLEYFLSYLCFRNIFPVKDLSKYDFCLLSQYLEVFDSAYSKQLSQLSESTTFQNILTQFGMKNKETLKSDYTFYTSKLKAETSNKQKTVLALRLPDTFEKFKKAVDKKKCAKCDRMPFSMDTQKTHKFCFGVSVCLICEYSVCRTMCKVDIDQNKPLNIGNLNQHAIDAHGGSCVFIDALITNVTYIHYPKNIVYDSIYSTKYGELVGQSTLNWSDFHLDSQINETIRKAVIYNSIPETLFKYMNGYDSNYILFQEKYL